MKKNIIIAVVILLLIANLGLLYLFINRKDDNQLTDLQAKYQIKKDAESIAEVVEKDKNVPVFSFAKTPDCDIGKFESSFKEMDRLNYPSNKARIFSLDGSNINDKQEIPYRGVKFDGFMLYGINSSGINAVDITWDGDNVVEKIPEVVAGVNGWCYKINDQKAKVGLNSYQVKFHPKDGEVIEYGFSINWTQVKAVDDEHLSLDVKWFPELIELDARSVLTDVLLNSYNHEYLKKEYYRNLFKIYKSGLVVSAGKFKDYDFLILIRDCDSMCSKESYYKVLYNEKNNEIVYLSKYSEKLHDNENQFLTIADNIVINDLKTPEVISIPNSSLKLLKTQDPFLLFNKYLKPEKKFSYNEELFVYKDSAKGCFVVRTNDGTAREYYFDLSLMEKAGEKIDTFLGATPYLLNFTLLDGSKNKEEYIYKDINSYFKRGCYTYADYITSVSQLKKIGQINNGDFIYTLKDNDFKINTSEKVESTILQDMYDVYYPGWDADKQQEKEKMSFDEFVNNRPLVYWQDPFGDFMEFKNAKFLPAIEMGKPVIYLYPEKEMDVLVKVSPNGGFSLTEPEYGNGWLVKAKPDGELYNYGDGKKYPYLFWEGKGVNYVRPEKGFVVEKKDVGQFLQDKLTKLGLAQHEIDEFVEFWLPRMQAKNYYFITFVDKEIFDQIAPLDISPRPDTVIRVFMDYEGLDEYVKVEEPEIFTPKRKGFTVVEWGGALR